MVTMMQDHFRQALEDCDVALVRKLWAHVAPHLPQPRTDEETLQRIHGARTAARSIPFQKRAYSHAWLMERALPSGLPDHMRASAERMYPVTVAAVGISVNSKYEFVERAISGVMRDAVLEAESDGRLKDDAHVKRRMMEAREREQKGLGLRRK